MDNDREMDKDREMDISPRIYSYNNGKSANSSKTDKSGNNSPSYAFIVDEINKGLLRLLIPEELPRVRKIKENYNNERLTPALTQYEYGNKGIIIFSHLFLGDNPDSFANFFELRLYPTLNGETLITNLEEMMNKYNFQRK